MKSRFVLSPAAISDLVKIWRRVRAEAGAGIAERVESAILDKVAFLSFNPAAGHWRKTLTEKPVKFFPIYSYLIVYRPDSQPLQIVRIIHGRRDVRRLLRQQPKD